MSPPESPIFFNVFGDLTEVTLFIQNIIGVNI
jgi:hypothetical protein